MFPVTATIYTHQTTARHIQLISPNMSGVTAFLNARQNKHESKIIVCSCWKYLQRFQILPSIAVLLLSYLASHFLYASVPRVMRNICQTEILSAQYKIDICFVFSLSSKWLFIYCKSSGPFLKSGFHFSSALCISWLITLFQLEAKNICD